MIPASLALCIVLGIAVERVVRRWRRADGRALRGSERELDRFVADLRRSRDEDATQIVRGR